MKKSLSLLCALVTLTFSGTQAFAADYNFKSERSDDFYKPSSAQLKSDGSGKFQIVPDSSVITSDDGYLTVIKKVKDLNDKDFWDSFMIARKRKTLALCESCHVKLHAGKLD